MGIRIEDIIVITEDGHTNLMDEIPKEADVIEELLARRAPSSP
jgi:Xaa-Pro aminopeptidase